MKHACMLGLLAAALAGRAADMVWIEAEAPSATNMLFKTAGWGRTEFLSGGRWLSLTVEADKAAQALPAGGALATYRFDAATAGKREVWARIGFEFVRSPFDWRLDDGEWRHVEPSELTTDLMEIGEWCEVAWLKLGDIDLAAGTHTLGLRLPRTVDDKGKTARVLFACDAFCLSPDPFRPNGPHRPGEPWQTGRDRAAAAHVFRLPAPPDAAMRSSVSLAGPWEVARDDEQLPGEVAAPIAALPAHPFWRAIDVPGDKNETPALVFAHRLWYRTRVEVPAALAGRSFHLVFPANSLNTTVYVNGRLCGFDKNPFARVQLDVSAAMRPGTNEVWVGIRDTWYAREADPADPMKLRRTFNVPLSVFRRGWQRLVYPVWGMPRAGILGTPRLVCGGPVYTADVFCKPSVARRELALEVTLANPQGVPFTGELLAEAVHDVSGKVAWRAPPQFVSLGAGETRTLAFAAPWADAPLWWPDDPQLHRLRATLRTDGHAVDVAEQLFGFREWTWGGTHLKLNGITWQGFTEHGIPGSTPEAWIASLKSPTYNYGLGRMWPQHGGRVNWLGLEPDDALTFMDRHGAVIRRSGYLDGELIGYHIEQFPQLATNWIDHLQAWIRGERNHPSVMVWSIENEMTFINARNTGKLDIWEPIVARAWAAVQAVDPTRPAMVDGGGALRSQALPIHGDHYSTKPFWNYPQLAYEANTNQTPWTWDLQRPKIIGEELFAAGINPAYAYFGGEAVFQGKVASRPAVGLAMQIISQGYRWFGVTACDFCQGPSDADGSQYNGWAPRAVLARQWDWTFASGRPAPRTLGIFNNTRFPEPLDFTWTLSLDGREVGRDTTRHAVPPGGRKVFDLTLPIPRARARAEGELILTLTAQGKEIFRDGKAVSVLPEPAKPSGLDAGRLFVHDPQGRVAAWLKAHGVAFTVLDRLAAPPVPGKVWLVGPDALTVSESASGAFAAYQPVEKLAAIAPPPQPEAWELLIVHRS
jgi:hypothetical protein